MISSFFGACSTNPSKGVFRTQWNILDERFAKTVNAFKSFCKNASFYHLILFFCIIDFFRFRGALTKEPHRIRLSMRSNSYRDFSAYWIKLQQETLRVVTIAMIYSILLWKFNIFPYKPVQYLWESFYCENSKPLSIFTKKLHRRCLHGF